MKKKILIFILVLVLLYSLGGITYYFFKKEDVVKDNTIETIENYPYTLKDNATPYIKEEFYILKDNLESVAINNEEFSYSIAKLFIINLYTIDNKYNKYDVELDYVYPDARENYKLNVTDTLYKYVESKENQTLKLPIVSNINKVSEKEITFEIGDKTYEGYEYNLTIEYEEDLDYDKEVTVTVIKVDKLYYVVMKK